MRIALIPARGRSKRIPRKNIRLFAGQPIIAYPIRAAFSAGLFDRIIVSTDDDEIAEVVAGLGAETPFKRPEELADHTALGIENLEPDLAGGLAGQVIVEVRPDRRVLRLIRPSSESPAPKQAVRLPHLEEVRVGRRHLGGKLQDGRVVVQDPEAPAHGRQHHVLVHDFDVRHRSDREVELEGLPVLPVIEGNEHPKLGSGIEQAFPIRIFPDHVHGVVVRNPVAAGRDPRPRLTVVLSLVDIGLEIAEQVTQNGDVRLGRVV